MGNACPYKNVPVHYCDCCGQEIGEICDTFYETNDGNELCEDCFKKYAKENFDDILFEFEEKILDWLGTKKCNV